MDIKIKSVINNNWHGASYDEALRWAQYLYNNQKMNINDINGSMINGVNFTRSDLILSEPPNIWRGFKKEN